MLVHGGVFVRDGALVRGPELDAQQTGYGPGYRLYECADGTWLALVLPDEVAWRRLEAEVGRLGEYTPLRTGADDGVAVAAERLLEVAFRAGSAVDWVARLRALGVPAEVVALRSRDEFRRGVLDDPVNRQLGRVAAFTDPSWGRFEQIGPLLRYGPGLPGGGPALHIPVVGEHSVEVLTELGFGSDEIDAWLAAKIVNRP
jgi:crotonobetainyl-CoA:carnitine CoA-transferase CaiB-like acyl-CoA transferase